MARKVITNLGASIQAKLLNISREQKRSHESVLLQYCQERLLYRLSQSPYRDQFLLKGALLYWAYAMPSLRPTKDIDLLGRDTSLSDAKALTHVFLSLAGMDYPDGIEFIAEPLEIAVIQEQAKYAGLRVHIEARLAKARLKLQIDIGFGDVIFPKPVKKSFPALLAGPSPVLYLYPLETSVAEKFEAMASRKYFNSRLKDFYDVLSFAAGYNFQKALLGKAIQTTFAKRNTLLGEIDAIFSQEFSRNETKGREWKGFLKRHRLESPFEFEEVMLKIRAFLNPVVDKPDDESTWDSALWRWVAPSK